jgi:hypothetical protein
VIASKNLLHTPLRNAIVRMNLHNFSPGSGKKFERGILFPKGITASPLYDIHMSIMRSVWTVIMNNRILHKAAERNKFNKKILDKNV